MDNFNEIIEEFENKKTTHPQIATLWQAYLITKRNQLDKLIEQGNLVLDLLEEQDDISMLTLLILYHTHRFE
tara:strand:+ start:683 stop:898 length:216 start_codon:yes stop_codon:yes gene_type:complete